VTNIPPETVVNSEPLPPAPVLVKSEFISDANQQVFEPFDSQVQHVNFSDLPADFGESELLMTSSPQPEHERSGTEGFSGKTVSHLRNSHESYFPNRETIYQMKQSVTGLSPQTYDINTITKANLQKVKNDQSYVILLQLLQESSKLNPNVFRVSKQIEELFIQQKLDHIACLEECSDRGEMISQGDLETIEL
jgi:hypothetical protein